MTRQNVFNYGLAVVLSVLLAPVFAASPVSASAVLVAPVAVQPVPSTAPSTTNAIVLPPEKVAAPAPTSAPMKAPIPTPTVNIPQQPLIVPTPPNATAVSYVLMDANSGKVIAEKNKDQRVPPASLTKLMTLFIAFDALQRGKVALNSLAPVSQKAWRTGGSKMFIKVGSSVPIQDLLQGIIVQSGNDACIAMSEFLAGSEDSFVNMMNYETKAIGMNSTNFTDCTGMPNANHYTTAYDLALLAQAMIQYYPQYYPYFSQKWFLYNGIKQPNRNRLLWRFPGADGLKTGHTDEAGYCLVSSAVKDGMRLIAVIMGAPSDEVRANDSMELLTYGFRFFTTRSIYPANTVIAHPRVWFGDQRTLNAGIRYNLAVTVPQGSQQEMMLSIQTMPNLVAPIQKGQTVGQVTIKQGNEVIATQPLISLDTINQGGFFRRLFDHIIKLFSRTGAPKEILQKLTFTPVQPSNPMNR